MKSNTDIIKEAALTGLAIYAVGEALKGSSATVRTLFFLSLVAILTYPWILGPMILEPMYDRHCAAERAAAGLPPLASPEERAREHAARERAAMERAAIGTARLDESRRKTAAAIEENRKHLGLNPDEGWDIPARR